MMPTRYPILLLFAILVPLFTRAQSEASPRSFEATRIFEKITVDGLDRESAWAQAPVLSQFTQWQGDVGKPATSRTEVRLLYDDEAVYIFARLYDRPEDVRREISERDEIANSDFFGVFFDPFLSGIDAFEFLVTAAGGQLDAKLAPWGEDRTWDAVWQSKVRHHADSWTVEMAIPYSALRFPSTSEQIWGVNFVRSIQRIKEKSSWNPIDPNVAGIVQQSGRLTGIRDIKPPLRLSATPYFSAGLKQGRTPDGKQHITYPYSVGGDIKWGLSKAFTLDMTVIPDFSQTRSDELIYNISPFETYYPERRPFFTEGTELFEKGDIIYTRRIAERKLVIRPIVGSISKFFNNEPQLINASKITGRTDKKLGVGFLNAIVAPDYADNPLDSNLERILLSPLTNYNALVLDQQLKNNSFVAITNTNVWRKGDFRKANVTALDSDIFSKDNKWGGTVIGAFSHVKDEYGDIQNGHRLLLRGGKVSGKLTYRLRYEEVDTKYDPRDFGYIETGNIRDLNASVGFSHRKFTKHFRSYFLSLRAGMERLYKPDAVREIWFNLHSFFTTRRFFSFGGGLFVRPVPGRDYFAPRISGYYLAIPSMVGSWIFISTDYNKAVALDVNAGLEAENYPGARAYSFSTGLRYRASNRLTMRLDADIERQYNYRGWVDYYYPFDPGSPPDIIFGLRDLNTLVTSFSIGYKLNPDITFNLYTRNYWYAIKTKDLFLLTGDGRLVETDFPLLDSDGNPRYDKTVDYLNVDFVGRWHFAPGSDMYLSWKIFSSDLFDRTLPIDQSLPKFRDLSNSITLKALYYLDFNSLLHRKNTRE